MENFDSVVLGFVFISFPLLLYLFYVAHNKNLEKQESDLFFGLALFSSAYLLIKQSYTLIGELDLLLINIPLIVAYIKNKRFEVLMISIITIFYFYSIVGHHLIYMLIECLIYFVIYVIKNKNIWKINDYLFGILILSIRGISYALYIDSINVTNSILIFALSCMILIFIILLIEKGDDILKYHMTYKELEKEKQIKQSLFQITHEIKNPLAVCKGYLDMLDVNKREQCEKYISVIKEEIDRTLLLLQDFLCISKIKLNNDILDINLLLEESLESLKEIAEEKNIEIIYSDEDEIYLNADYNRLVQVVINIVKNSIEAFEDGKRGQIKISTKVDRDYVKIFFEDNGMGIKKENLEKIKKPFFTTKSQGTGLGISLTNEIIEAHKGEMQYKSEYGTGTTVTVKLPLARYF